MARTARRAAARTPAAKGPDRAAPKARVSALARARASAITPAEARRLDLNSAEHGVSITQLMANAGRALADAVLAAVAATSDAGRAAPDRDVVLLCGKGNNGGDGFVAARRLHEQGLAATVVLAEPQQAIRSPAARAAFEALDPEQVRLWSGPDPAWDDAAVLVDCLLGTGVAGAPRKPYDAVIRWLNARKASGAFVLACDVPSGLGGRLAVHPTATLTFHAPKQGLTKASAGRITVAPIGIPPEAQGIGLGDLDQAYPRPATDAHKGDNGTVLVVAGSIPLAGAAFYCAAGALRTGADLVHIATPEEAAPPIRTWGPEPIVHGVDGPRHLTPAALPALERLLARCDAVLVGPGLGTAKETQAAIRQVLAAAARRRLPTVVDADALDAVDPPLLRKHGARMVLTPHAREFQDLTGQAATRANVLAYARRHNVTVLRKSAIDVVSDGTTTRECTRGHPTLTVGGTGDVLAGIVAALLAKGAAPFAAACAASYLLKVAGEDAATHLSYGASAIDVAEHVPGVLLRLP